MHVNDVIAGHGCSSMANTSEVVNIFNVATDDVLDVTSIAKIVIAEMGLSDVELAYTGGDRGWKGDVPQVRLVLDKIHALGWYAQNELGPGHHRLGAGHAGTRSKPAFFMKVGRQ